MDPMTIDEQGLRYAAQDGDLTRLRALLAKGVHVDARESGRRMNRTALHYAAMNGHTACLGALLAAGASADSVDDAGMTALHDASVNDRVACVRALLATGVNVDAREYFDLYTALACALEKGHRRVLKILLRAGATMRLTTGLSRVERTDRNTSAWAIFDAIRAAGGWGNYVTRRRTILVRAISDATGRRFPDVINMEIISFAEPPGGY